ncbi:hypothetical protein ES703_39732 [subsurface metagenome]
MEIQVARLRDTLGILKPAVPRKPTLKILENALVKDGQLMATDLDSMVIINMPEADESFLLPYQEIVEMIQYVPGYEYMAMHVKRGKLTLSWSEGEATYPTQDIEEFPSIPAFEVMDEADIDGDTFIPTLKAALPYAATGSDRPVLNGVTVQFGAPIEVSAGDGFRMAHIVLPLEFPAEYTTIIPAGAVSTLVHVMDKTPRTPSLGEGFVDAMLARRQLRVALDSKRGLRVVFSPSVSTIIKLVDGNPPAWLKLIPKDEPILKAQFFARELDTAVRRVKDVAQQSSGLVRLQFDGDTGIVSARADGKEVSAKISVLNMQGAPNRLALSVGYLTEYLRGKDGIITMSWTGNTSPVSFQASKSPRVIIMPMEAKWDKPLPADQTEPEAATSSPEQPAEAEPEANTSKPQKRPRKKKQG